LRKKNLINCLYRQHTNAYKDKRHKKRRECPYIKFGAVEKTSAEAAEGTRKYG